MIFEMKNRRAVFIFLFFLSATFSAAAQQLYSITEGTVAFRSEAPLELIEAASSKLKGVIDTQKQTFAFTVESATFEGFNSKLQREHFNENYMESDKYPKSSFSGKIIEKVDFSKDGEYVIRAKGKLTIHGVEQERIIRSVIIVKNGEVQIKSNFTVLLKDHNITIPRVVHQKIAEEINVEISAVAKKK